MINENTPTTVYELPDGTNVELGNERFKIPEILISNNERLENGVIGFQGIPQMVYDSVTKCEMDIRKELFNNIVLAGGNTLFNGFNDKLQTKLFDLTNQNQKIKIVASNSSIERRFSAWIGGSILSSLASIQNSWMTKSDYEEHGPSLIERKIH